MHRVPGILLALATTFVTAALFTEPAEEGVEAADAPAWAIRAGATALCSVDVGFACNELGEIYRLGYGTKEDSKSAAGYYAKACEIEYGPGCYNLASAYRAGDGVRKDSKKAATYQKKSCKLGVNAACSK